MGNLPAYSTYLRQNRSTCKGFCRFIELWSATTTTPHPGIHLRRDNLSSIAYSEELISSTISATLQSTDRHHGIVGQKRFHFQLNS
jgi:hypothetical protein